MKTESVLILHDIRSVQNIGAIMRTADAVGIVKVYFTGYTPTPVDRFGRARKDFVKASLGAEDFVVWEHVENIFELLKKLKDEAFSVVAVEQATDAVDYRNIERSPKMAFILGNEVDGISQDILDHCDVVAEIPMFGKKESLNVSVATGIVLYGILYSFK